MTRYINHDDLTTSVVFSAGVASIIKTVHIKLIGLSTDPTCKTSFDNSPFFSFLETLPPLGEELSFLTTHTFTFRR